MGIPTFFIIFIIFIILFRYKMSKSENKETKSRDYFWKKESESHYVRKKELSESDFVKPDFDRLPVLAIEQYIELGKERLFTYQENCRLLALEPLMNMADMLNSDVRLKYGTGQLDLIETYENNYIQYIKNLMNWAKGLYELGLLTESSIVLKEAIAMGSDVSHIYLLLGQIYTDTDNREELKDLLNQVAKSNFALKKKIIEGLTAGLSSIEAKY